MGDFNRAILENMGISKQDADSRERSRQEASVKVGGDGIDRMITMQERTLSNFMGAELHGDEERDRGEKERKAGREEFNVEYQASPAEALQDQRESKTTQSEKSTDQGMGL